MQHSLFALFSPNHTHSLSLTLSRSYRFCRLFRILMEVAAESALLNPSTFFPRSALHFSLPLTLRSDYPPRISLQICSSSRIPTNWIVPYARNDLFSSRFQQNQGFVCRFQQSEVPGVEDSITSLKLGFFVNRRIIALAATVIGVLVFGCRRVFAVEGVVDSGYGVMGQSIIC